MLGANISIGNPGLKGLGGGGGGGPVGHRHWRILIASDNGGQGMEWSALKYFQGGVEISNNGLIANASTTFNGYSPNKALSPQVSPGWASDFSGGYPQWHRIDFGEGNSVLPDVLKITAVLGNRTPNSWKLQYSDEDDLDPTTWVDYALFSTAGGWGNGSERTIPVVPL